MGPGFAIQSLRIFGPLGGPKVANLESRIQLNEDLKKKTYKGSTMSPKTTFSSTGTPTPTPTKVRMTLGLGGQSLGAEMLKENNYRCPSLVQLEDKYLDSNKG